MWRGIIRAKTVGIMSFASLALTVSGWLWAYFTLRNIADTPLILHFDDLSGITAVGGSGTLTFMGIFGIMVVAINFLIALALDARDRVLGKLAAAVTFVFSLLLFVAFAAIVNVN